MLPATSSLRALAGALLATIAFGITPACEWTPAQPATSGAASPHPKHPAQVQAGLNGARDEAHTSVVAVLPLDETGSVVALGTGTLIAPNVVLTAHHMVATFDTPGTVCGTTFSAPRPPSQIGIGLATDLGSSPRVDYVARAILVPPVAPGESEFCGADLALIVLAAPIPDLEPVPVALGTSVALATPYTEVGYGRLTAGDPSSRGTRRSKDYEVLCQDGDAGCVQRLAAREWLGSGGGCVGDSGGPALHDGAVEGVASHAAPNCGEVVWVSVKAWTAWLERSLRAVAADTGVPVPAWLEALPAGPVACTRHAECPLSTLCAAAGLCVAAAPGAACVADDDCDAQEACDEARGACVPRGFYDGEPWVAPVEVGPEAQPEGQPEAGLVEDVPAMSGGDTSTTTVVEPAAPAASDAGGCAGAGDGAWGALAGLALIRGWRCWRRSSRARARD